MFFTYLVQIPKNEIEKREAVTEEEKKAFSPLPLFIHLERVGSKKAGPAQVYPVLSNPKPKRPLEKGEGEKEQRKAQVTHRLTRGCFYKKGYLPRIFWANPVPRIVPAYCEQSLAELPVCVLQYDNGVVAVRPPPPVLV